MRRSTAQILLGIPPDATVTRELIEARHRELARTPAAMPPAWPRSTRRQIRDCGKSTCQEGPMSTRDARKRVLKLAESGQPQHRLGKAGGELARDDRPAQFRPHKVGQ